MKINHVEEFAGKGIQGDALAGTISCGSRNFIESLGIDVPNHTPDIVGTEVFVAYQGKSIGCLMIADKIKSDAVQTMERLKAQGLRIEWHALYPFAHWERLTCLNPPI